MTYGDYDQSRILNRSPPNEQCLPDDSGPFTAFAGNNATRT
ncbi:MAG: hypothetical protein R3C49_18015 [Planctomycetaceae bacterium]